MTARATALLLGMAAWAGCGAPVREGPQLLDPPDGFARDANCSAARSPIPGLQPESQLCYVRMQGDVVDWVTIGRFPGRFDLPRLREAQAAYAKRWGSCSTSYCTEFGEPAQVTLDGRKALAWSTSETAGGKVSGAGYTALVIYDDAVYAVEFDGSREPYLDPARVRAVVHSFAVRSGHEHLPLTLVVALAVAGAAVLAWRRVRRMQVVDPVVAPPPVRVSAVERPVPPAAAAGPRRPPLLDAQARLGAAAARHRHDPAGAIAELEALRTRYAPSAAVLHRLCLWHLEQGSVETAVERAREALPVLVRAGNLRPASEIVERLAEHRDRLGLTPAQLELLATTLART